MTYFIKTCLSAFLVFSLYNPLFAEISDNDSLDYKLGKARNDSAKMDVLCGLCYDNIYSDKNKAKHYSQLVLDFCKKTKHEYSLADGYRTAASYYLEVPDYENAIFYYEKSLNISKKINTKDGRTLYAKTLLNYGLLYQYNADYEGALKLYLASDSILTEFNVINHLINLYGKLAEIYERFMQQEKSDYYYKTIVKLAEQTTDPFSIANAYISFANSLQNSRKYAMAEKFYLKALKLAEQNNLASLISIVYFNMADQESKQKNYLKAVDYLKNSLKICRQLEYKYEECDALKRIGKSYEMVGEHGLAKRYLEQGMTLARQNHYKELLNQLLDAMVLVEQSLGNYKKALECREEYTTLYLETVDMNVKKQVNFLDAKYQAQKRESQIARLENDKKFQALQLSKHRQWIYGLVSILFLLLILALFVYWFYRHKKQIAQQENVLKEQRIKQLEKQQQVVASQSLIQGEETERSRLARDLHDGLGGLLSGIKLALSNVKRNVVLSAEDTTQFNKALGMIDTSITELRKVAHNMMPEALVKFGLKEALSDFCSSLENKTIDIKFQYFGSNKRVNTNMEIGLYRIAQELINNAIKYSEATELLIQLIQDEHRINLTVQDNGKGFDISTIQVSKGAGIANIRSRIESFNGRLDISSEPGKGAEINIELDC